MLASGAEELLTGDRRSQSPVVLPPISGFTFQVQLPPLCVGLEGWAGFALFARVGGWAALRFKRRTKTL
jgi:hypothetical protein